MKTIQKIGASPERADTLDIGTDTQQFFLKVQGVGVLTS